MPLIRDPNGNLRYDSTAGQPTQNAMVSFPTQTPPDQGQAASAQLQDSGGYMGGTTGGYGDRTVAPGFPVAPSATDAGEEAWGNKAMFEESVFRQLGGNPYLIDPYERARALTEEKERDLFNAYFDGAAHWGSRHKLTPEQRAEWDAVRKSFEARAFQELNHKLSQAKEAYTFMMGRFDAARAERQAAAERKAAQEKGRTWQTQEGYDEQGRKKIFRVNPQTGELEDTGKFAEEPGGGDRKVPDEVVKALDIVKKYAQGVDPAYSTALAMNPKLAANETFMQLITQGIPEDVKPIYQQALQRVQTWANTLNPTTELTDEELKATGLPKGTVRINADPSTPEFARAAEEAQKNNKVLKRGPDGGIYMMDKVDVEKEFPETAKIIKARKDETYTSGGTTWNVGAFAEQAIQNPDKWEEVINTGGLPDDVIERVEQIIGDALDADPNAPDVPQTGGPAFPGPAPLVPMPGGQRDWQGRQDDFSLGKPVPMPEAPPGQPGGWGSPSFLDRLYNPRKVKVREEE